MSEIEKKRKDFVAYEYKEVIVESDKASFMIDGYENFGWEIDGNVTETMVAPAVPNSHKVTIRFKRNRKIINKMELTRLQRNFEACVNEIDVLEGKKTSKAVIYAMVVAMLGCAFMAGSVFAVTAATPNIPLCIIFAIPAFVGWILPYFIYKNTVEKQTQKLNPLIETKYDEIYELCEKGNKLLF